MTIAQVLGRRLEVVRLGLGWSQEQVAKASGVSLAAYSNIENGRSSPTVEQLLRLAAALGRPASQFLDNISSDISPSGDQDHA